MSPQKVSPTRRWLWLRGLARQSLHWYDFPHHFREKFPDTDLDQVEQLDARGNGNQSHLPSFLSIDDYVRDFRSRSELGKQGPLHLLTMSLGSMIGIRWAQLYPGDLASLTIINTSDAKHSSLHERLRWQNLPLIFDTLSHPRDSYRMEANVMNMIAKNVANKEAAIQAFAKMPRTSNPNLFRQLFAASRFSLPEKAPEVPLLILAGRQDLFVSPLCSERIGKAWQHPVRWHEEGGHDLPLEKPEWVVQELHNFISNLSHESLKK